MGTATRGAGTEWRRYWYLPLVAGLGFSTSTMQTYGTGPFIAPLQHDFGWTRAEITSGMMIANLASALFCTFVGLLIDRVGPRRVGLVGVPLVAVAFALLSTATGTLANWWLLWSLIAIAALFVQGTIWTSAVVSRFEAGRGMAIAITLSGTSVGGALVPPLATWLAQGYGWRMAVIGLAALWGLVFLPILFLFFRGAQDERRTASAAAAAPAMPLPGLQLSEGLRRPAFYKLLVAGGLFSFTMLAMIVHLMPLLLDAGTPKMMAAWVASLTGVGAIVGRLATGWLLDRFPAHRVGAIVYLLPILGCGLLLADVHASPAQMTAALVFGLTMGSETDVITYLVTRHFGLRAFGTIMSAVFSAIALGAAFGPIVAGATFDHFGSYAPFMIAVIGLSGICSALLLSLRKPPEIAR